MKVGNLVKVVNNGKAYPNNYRLFEKLGLRNKLHNPSFLNGTVARVFNVDGDNLALVDTDGNECVINIEGVKRLSFERKPKEVKRTIQVIFRLTAAGDLYMQLGLSNEEKEAIVDELRRG